MAKIEGERSRDVSTCGICPMGEGGILEAYRWPRGFTVDLSSSVAMKYLTQ